MTSVFLNRERAIIMSEADKMNAEGKNGREYMTLSPSGGREVVDEKRASEIVEEWDVVLSGSPKYKVDKIVLSNKSYTAGAAVIIGDFISKRLAADVEVAILSDIIASRMEEEGLQVLQIISDSFKKSNLIEVDLSDNAMGSKGIKACSSVLGGQSSSLQRLSLCNNGLSEASMEEVADILTSSDQDEDFICENLTKIHFFNNMSGDKGCEAFARILSQTTDKLVDVRFSGTRTGRDGSILLANALDRDSFKHVKKLDLADNSFGPEGAQILSRTLVRCFQLEYLNLRDCVLEDGGVERICHALFGSDSSSDTLQHLDVSGNEITARASASLADLLEECNQLQIFHAEENEMTSRGFQKLAKSLPSTLQEIKLGCNECGNIGAKALMSIHNSLNQLHTLHIDGNFFSTYIVQDLERTFGDKLIPFEDNDEDADVDDELSTESESDSDDQKEEEITDNRISDGQPSNEMGELTNAIGKVNINSTLC